MVGCSGSYHTSHFIGVPTKCRISPVNWVTSDVNGLSSSMGDISSHYTTLPLIISHHLIVSPYTVLNGHVLTTKCIWTLPYKISLCTLSPQRSTSIIICFTVYCLLNCTKTSRTRRITTTRKRFWFVKWFFSSLSQLLWIINLCFSLCLFLLLLWKHMVLIRDVQALRWMRMYLHTAQP